MTFNVNLPVSFTQTVTTVTETNKLTMVVACSRCLLLFTLQILRFLGLKKWIPWLLPYQLPSCCAWYTGHIPSLCNHREWVVEGGHTWCLCVYYFVFSTVGFVVIPSECAITDHSPSGKDIDPLFSAAALWRTRVTESRHSFYWMGWVNPKSECKTEINFWY